MIETSAEDLLAAGTILRVLAAVRSWELPWPQQTVSDDGFDGENQAAEHQESAADGDVFAFEKIDQSLSAPANSAVCVELGIKPSSLDPSQLNFR